ncbi:MAG TPA: hypothetical protein VGM72_13820 [Micropepsaceae bacterium]|jgi:hypothetical protein
MFNSTILDVVAGLLFTFLTVSLVASTVTEGLASLLGWRAQMLLRGVKSLLNDPHFTGLAKDLYNHALVNSQASGTAQTENALAVKPSYIEPQHFAGALIDLMEKLPATRTQTQTQIQAAILQIPNPQLQQTLQFFYTRAGADITTFQNEIATWFDSSMSRLSGLYKRWMQICSFAVGLGVAVVLNVDALHVAQALWVQPAIIQKFAPKEGINTQEALDALYNANLPIGWSQQTARASFASPLAIASLMGGWLITAFATLFGAPFWFDALQKITNLRGAGPKPNEKKR